MTAPTLPERLAEVLAGHTGWRALLVGGHVRIECDCGNWSTPDTPTAEVAHRAHVAAAQAAVFAEWLRGEQAPEGGTGYDLVLCACESPIVGTRRVGDPDRCEACWRMSRPQWLSIVAGLAERATEVVGA